MTRRVKLCGLLVVAVCASACATTERQAGTDMGPETVRLPRHVLGAVETVVLHPAGARFEARIDTGATTSSISAVHIEEYESDGGPWVRFDVPRGEEQGPLRLEAAVTRVILVKRHGAEPTRRPVVDLSVQIGDLHQMSEFSLTDRTAFEFPVLIGRTFLEGVAVVDVARDHVGSEGKRSGPTPAHDSP